MTPNRRTAIAVGVALLGLYATAAGLTIRFSGRHVRPLFEGVGPSQPYQWVNPPPAFQDGNVKPGPTTVDIDLGPAGTPLTGVASADTQIDLNLPAGAVAAQAGDTKVTFTVTPIDPATLAPVPAGLRPDGNAYRVEAAYRPSGRPVTAVAHPGDVVVAMPEAFRTLLYSADGRSWQPLDARPVATASTAGAVFAQLGYYLGAAPPSTAPAHHKGRHSVVAIAAVTAALAFALGSWPVAFRVARRRRSRHPKAAGEPASSTGPGPRRPRRPGTGTRRR